MILRSDFASRFTHWLAHGLVLGGLGWSIFAWVGCSPSVSSGGATGGPGGTDTALSGAGAGNGTTTTTTECGFDSNCPTGYDAPSPGSSCMPDGLCCTYSRTDHAGGEDVTTVTCVNGKWH